MAEMASPLAEELVILNGDGYAPTEARSTHAVREFGGIVAFRIAGRIFGHSYKLNKSGLE